MLKNWFLQNKRSFPWRDNPSPYAVWISEIMLQQTRASVVVDYFNLWMERFPTIQALAQAPIHYVIKTWEGLGYYNRARNIKQAAELLVQEGKSLPDSLPELLAIKGIGPYTAGAILSFAFHQKAVAIDGNVKRVVSRYFGAEDSKSLEKNTLSLLPDEEPWITMEALIELGATVCLKAPLCHICPLKQGCFAYKLDKTAEIPQKKKKQEILSSTKDVAIVLYKEEVLLEVKETGTLLGGLAQFPSFPHALGISSTDQLLKHLGLTGQWIEDLPSTRQTFTKHVEELFPILFRAEDKLECPGFFWVKLEELDRFTFSSGHKRILQMTQLLDCV